MTTWCSKSMTISRNASLPATGAGISLDKIAVDPGIGFGKTIAHNLALMANVTLFHGLGVPILVGASRKRFIGGVSQKKSHA